MRRRFAPSHSVTGRHVFVPPDDSAWDRKRIDQECEQIRKAANWSAPKDRVEALRTDPSRHGDTAHVFWRYWDGLTRFDLEAEGVKQYLDLNAEPEVWVLRPLSIPERHVVLGYEEQGNHESGYAAAFLVGCQGLDAPRGKGLELDKLLRARAGEPSGSRPTDEKVLEAVQQIAYEIPFVVGSAIVRLSQDLTVEEKKPSAEPPGVTSGS